MTITTVSKEENQDPTIKEILAKYAARSRHIALKTVDPERNPGWARQYDPNSQGLAPGSLVVASGKKFKTIGVYDMYNYDTSNPNRQPQLTSLSVEQRVTSAVQFVTAAKNVTLYVLQDHGEQSLDSLGLSTVVGNENYAVKEPLPPHGKGSTGRHRHPAGSGSQNRSHRPGRGQDSRLPGPGRQGGHPRGPAFP